MFKFISSASISHSLISNQVPKSLSSAIEGIRYGGAIKEAKMRIKSVKAIQKITKTMKMIANARLRDAQVRMQRSRPFASVTSSVFEKTVQTPTLKSLIVLISSDRGLCGAINSSATRLTRNLIKERESKGSQVSLVCLGEKGVTALEREHGKKILFHASEISKKPPPFISIGAIAERLLSYGYENITLVYNKFNSVISYSTSHKDFVLAKAEDVPLVEYEFEGSDRLNHFRDLNEWYLATGLYNAIYESTASELAGRMTAMDNATRNANEMVKKLTIQMNRARQSAITTELCEIISGAAASSQKQ